MTQATGGVVTEALVDGGFRRIHTFLSSDNFVVIEPGTFECLIVGGGGGGVLDGYAGAGGAGGVLYGTLNAVAGSYAVTVGQGGAGEGNEYPGPGPGVTTVAEDSSIVIGATTYTAFRGGRGTGFGSPPLQGESGGSGGGTGNNNIPSGVTPGGLATQTTQGALTGYGHNGGAGGNIGNNRPYPAGGGGGAGAPGQNATSSRGGAGGAGIVNPIVGSTIGQLVDGQYYIAGGGGGFDDDNFNPGGIGGGGTNARTFPTDASSFGTAALPNTGGGGGGASRQWYGTDGGSGVVVISYSMIGVAFEVSGTPVIAANEGQTVTVTFTSAAATGAINYTISGVSTADISGAALSGTVNLVDYQATITLVLTEDVSIGEGAETMTVSFVENSVTYQADLTINDTSSGLSITPTAVPGDIVTVALNTSAAPVANGTEIPYTISGEYITAEFIGQPLTGVFVVNNNTAEFTIAIGFVSSTVLTVTLTALGDSADCAITFIGNITDIVVQSTADNVETGFVQISTVNYVNYAAPTTVTDTVENGGALNMYIVQPLGQALIREFWI